jgi:methylated-DNA-[protein]-cysteine S-methyltransferase
MASRVTDPLRLVRVATPIGALNVACSTDGVVATSFAEEGQDPDAFGDRLGELHDVPVRRSGARLADVRREIRDYFAGRSRAFSIPIDLAWGPTGFARRVLEVTATIPFGELWTYGDVAGMAGSPRGGRAAGGALSRCPIELFVPCHRVVHAGGGIGGYGRHDERKRWLIRFETSA